MLTRSASKKKSQSPKKSVKKKEEIVAVPDNLRDYKVMIPSIDIPNNEGNVRSPRLLVNFNVLPEENGSDEVTHGSSKTVFNCGVVVINMLPPDSDKEKQSNKYDTERKMPCSTPKSNHKTRAIDESKVECVDENYTETFSPKLTSSVKKCSSELRLNKLNKLGKRERNSESDSSGESFSKKMRLHICDMHHPSNTSDDLSDTSQKLSSYKGVFINGGYRVSDFKKKLVVQIVPMSEEEIKSWDNGSSCSANPCCSHKKAGSPDSEFKKMVRKEKLLKILKKADKSISRQLAEKRENNLVELRKSLESVPHDGGQSYDKNSSQNGGITTKTRREFDFNRVFGDFKTKLEKLVETDERFIESEFLEKYISYQDSICTEVFEDESLEQQTTLSSVSDMLGGEERSSNVNSSATDQSVDRWEHLSMYEEITNPLDRAAPERSSSESIALHTDGGDGTNKSGFANENQWSRPLSTRKKKENDSLRKIRKSNKKKLNKTGMGDATLKHSKKYRDRQTLLSIQLECINKEILSRSAQVESSSSKKLKQSRKSEKQSEDDVTRFGSARRTRRSIRVQEEAESKATPRTRNTPKTQSQGPMDEYVTVTPRSTRAKSFPREVTEVMDRKRKLEDLMETPKMCKTPKKASPREDEANDTNDELPSHKSKTSRKLMKKNETEDETAERKRGSTKKTSQTEAMEKDDGGERAEVTSSPKSKKSKSPMKSQTEETKDEFDEKAMEAVSSPLKKKKEAAERLRAEEEKLGQRKIKEIEMAMTSSPKKNRSPATAISEEVSVHIQSPTLSTLTPKLTRKSLVGRQMLLGESFNTEVPSSHKQKETKSPKKHIRDERTMVESEEVTTARSRSPEKRQMQEVAESESEKIDLFGGETPTRRKSKSPTKTRNLEVSEVEDKALKEVDLAVVTYPKRQKSKSPQKKQDNEVESVVEIASSKRQKSKSPKKKNVEDHEPEEIELYDMDMSMLSPKRQENASTKNWQIKEDESERSIVEEYMCTVSPQKQKMMKKLIGQQDMQVFCPDDSESDGTEILPVKEEKVKPSREEEPQESEPEGTDMIVKTPPERQEMRSPKKRTQQEDEERESEKGQESKSPREKLRERNVSESESEVESITSLQQIHVEEQEEKDSDVEMGVMTSPKQRKKQEMEESVSHTAASPDKQKQVEIEGKVQEGDALETFSRSKKSKSKKKTDKVQAEMSIPRLGEDLLATIPAQKKSVKVKDEAEISETLKRRNERKQKKLLKRLMKDDGYIPLEVGGPTNFSVVGLDKFNTSSRHPAYDLKRHLLYGSRVKRIPYSQVQSYQMKVESRKKRF